MPFVSIDPSSGRQLNSYPSIDDSKLETLLVEAHLAAHQWSSSTLDQRQQLCLALAESLESRADELATMISKEVGKPLHEAETEIDKSMRTLRHFVAYDGDAFAAETVQLEQANATISYEPYGTLLGIVPWNYPCWQIFRSLTPQLIAGNAFLYKPAPNTMGCARLVEEIIRAAQPPAGLIRLLAIEETKVEPLIADRRIRGVMFTGSVATGRHIGALCGRYLTKCTLELGGSDPFIVFDDAPLEHAAEQAVAARFYNAGQSCVSAKRFVVAQSIANQFIDQLKEAIDGWTVGHPTSPNTKIGPLARADLRNTILAQRDEAIAFGARCWQQTTFDSSLLESGGYYAPPALLTNVMPTANIVRQETFGPLALVFVADSEASMLDLANSNPFGLGASLWSQNPSRLDNFARQLECGVVCINHYVKSDPRLPFGGQKDSGLGREFGRAGLQEFTNIKTTVDFPL